MPITATSFTEDFATYAAGSMLTQGWTNVLGTGSPTVASSKAYISGLDSNTHGIATLDDSAGATLARVLLQYDLSGTTTRGAGAVLLCTSRSGGFNGYRVHSTLSGSGVLMTMDASWDVWAGGVQVAAGNFVLMNSTRLNGDTAGTFWLEAEVYMAPADAQGRRKFRVRTWKDTESVPAWTLDQLIDVGANGLSGPSGIAHRGAKVRYLSAYATGNWPVHPTAPVVTAPAGPTLERGAYSLEWSASTDADGDVPITYTGERRIDGGAWGALFSAQAGTTYAWDLSNAAGTTVQARVRATDTDGLASDWAEGPVLAVAALLPPAVPVVTSPAGPQLSRGTHTLAWDASDDPDALPGGMVEYEGEYTANGGARLPLFAWQTGTGYEWDMMPLGGTVLQAFVRARDDEGQVSDWGESAVLTVNAWTTCGEAPDTAWNGCGTSPATEWDTC